MAQAVVVMRPKSWIIPDWPAPASVQAVSTTREGGVSTGPYASMNLGDHVDDAPAAVAENRRRLSRYMALPSEPLWLRQVHSADVLGAGGDCGDCGDARIVSKAGQVAVVMTADCLPVLFCDRNGDQVAAAHAGWRGLAAGILEATVSGMVAENREIMAWMGPAIGPESFEVGVEVRAAFIEHDAHAEAAFAATTEGHYFADLYMLARQRLESVGVKKIYGGVYCSYRDAERFYSYRRDGATGRMASLIWITGEQ